jgi:phage shock protein C
MSETKRLYRSENNRVIGGICGGLGDYFGVDPVLVRLVFVALGLANGLGVLIYFIMWLIVPDISARSLTSEEVVRSNMGDISQQARHLGRSFTESGYGPLIIGALLIVLGAVFLLDDVFTWLSPALVWPVVMIVIGAFFLLKRR